MPLQPTFADGLLKRSARCPIATYLHGAAFPAHLKRPNDTHAKHALSIVQYKSSQAHCQDAGENEAHNFITARVASASAAKIKSTASGQQKEWASRRACAHLEKIIGRDRSPCGAEYILRPFWPYGGPCLGHIFRPADGLRRSAGPTRQSAVFRLGWWARGKEKRRGIA